VGRLPDLARLLQQVVICIQRQTGTVR
jgi:hypothetical protein